MTPAIKCLILLAIVALLFVTEMIPLAMTAIGASVACCALGLVPENQIFLGLADSTVVLFGGMFVVGAAMIIMPNIRLFSPLPNIRTTPPPIFWASPV